MSLMTYIQLSFSLSNKNKILRFKKITNMQLIVINIYFLVLLMYILHLQPMVKKSNTKIIIG